MEYIKTEDAPAAIGPYSQAVKHNGLLFLSGQIPLEPNTMELIEGGIKAQTEQVLNNLDAILGEAGLSYKDVLKTTVFLKDMSSFVEMNKVYENYFKEHKPARATVEVCRLPKDVLVEIECIAAEEK